MYERAEQIETLRERLEALRVRIHGLPPDELIEEGTIQQNYHELDAIRDDLRLLIRDAGSLRPESKPLVDAFQETEALSQWLRPLDEHDLGRLDHLVDRAREALGQAEPLTRITDTFQEVGFIRGRAEHALQCDESAKAHGFVRQMIDLLQGVSREVRALDRGSPDRGGQER